MHMLERPGETEAAPSFFTYINQVAEKDPFVSVERQLDDAMGLFRTISEERSLHRYAREKWTIRQLLNHVTDTERAFAFRLLWFGRGFEAPLPGYDQDIAAKGADADAVSWTAHVEEFKEVRLATISLYKNMPATGWGRGGIANEKFVSTRALGWIIPGHVAHHLTILRGRYL
jgi:hypothetical protein